VLTHQELEKLSKNVNHKKSVDFDHEEDRIRSFQDKMAASSGKKKAGTRKLP